MSPLLTVGVDKPYGDPLAPTYVGLIGHRMVFCGTTFPWWAQILCRLRLGIVIVETA